MRIFHWTIANAHAALVLPGCEVFLGTLAVRQPERLHVCRGHTEHYAAATAVLEG